MPKSIRIKIKSDCRNFSGSSPCLMNKRFGNECPGCISYSSHKERILVIKLGAIGDVLRTTCILPAIKEKFPFSFIAWVTKPGSIELLSSNPDIDRVFDSDNMECFNRLQVEEWDHVYNLDNSHASAALASLAKAKSKKGFILSKEGVITSVGNTALKWLEMASFDRLKRKNTVSYQEIIYEICGFSPPVNKPGLFLSPDMIKWAGGLFSKFNLKGKGKPILVGINTGSGSRWPKKMLDAKSIIKVIKELQRKSPDWFIILLGGPEEKDKNNAISRAVNSKNTINIGCGYSILQFSAIISRCSVVLTGDTLALHIASALGIPSVALFGPTSINEIYGYNGLVLKMQAKLGCTCCYGDCAKAGNCMNLIPAREIAQNLRKQAYR